MVKVNKDGERPVRDARSYARITAQEAFSLWLRYPKKPLVLPMKWLGKEYIGEDGARQMFPWSTNAEGRQAYVREYIKELYECRKKVRPNALQKYSDAISDLIVRIVPDFV